VQGGQIQVKFGQSRTPSFSLSKLVDRVRSDFQKNPQKDCLMKRKPRYLAYVAAILSLASWATPGFPAGTPEQRRACEADAMKFCKDVVPDVPKITACMKRNLANLSPDCRAQFK
jgi:hypothetical protein